MDGTFVVTTTSPLAVAAGSTGVVLLLHAGAVTTGQMGGRLVKLLSYGVSIYKSSTATTSSVRVRLERGTAPSGGTALSPTPMRRRSGMATWTLSTRAYTGGSFTGTVRMKQFALVDGVAYEYTAPYDQIVTVDGTESGAECIALVVDNTSGQPLQFEAFMVFQE